MKNRLIVEQTIDPEDHSRLLLTDSPEDAAKRVLEVGIKQFGLKYGRRPRKSWLLWE
jgi:hypothetical protein